MGFMKTVVAATVLSASALTAQKLDYPKPHTVDQVDDYFGTKVADPYRWMENVDAPEVKQWVDAENTLTRSYLDAIPGRDALKSRLMALTNYERFSAPARYGKRYIYSHNTGLQNQAVLFWQEGLTGEPHVLIDPNTLAADGTVALSGLSITDDGALMAYGLAEAGSDWVTWHVRNISTGHDTPDVVAWSKFSGAAWLKDNSGFFYEGYERPDKITKENSLKIANYFHKVYFHKLGTPQSEDTLIFDRPDDKELNVGASVTDDGRYLIIHQTRGTSPNNQITIKDLAHPEAALIKLVTTEEAVFDPIDNEGTYFYFLTTLDAPNGKVIGIDLAHPERSAWKTLIPESKNKLDGVTLVHDTLIAHYLKDAQSHIELHAKDGHLLRTFDLPAIGDASGFGGKRTDAETFFTFTNFTSPPTVYRLDLKTTHSTIYRQPKLLFDPSKFETKQVFFSSKDGTRVPVFLTYKKGLKLDGQNPTLLYGYGGFNVSLPPAFAPSYVLWMEMGGIYAQVTLRGGGEYGEALASGRHEDPQAKRLRRLHWCRRVPHRQQVHLHAQAGHPGRQQRRSPCRSLRAATPGSLRRCDRAGRRHGHAPLRQVHHRLGLEGRLRRTLRQRSRVPRHLQVLPSPQREARRRLSTHPHHHRRPRRPRLPRAQLQVRGHDAKRREPI